MTALFEIDISSFVPCFVSDPCQLIKISSKKEIFLLKFVIFVAVRFVEPAKMDIVLSIAACILAILGIVGAVVPVLPGPVLSYGGLLCIAAASFAGVSASTLWIGAGVTVAVTLADYFLPAWMAKRFGGSRAGAIGATIGAVAGIFIFPPIGILLGPFVGAVIGEFFHDSNDTAHAVQVGIGSFLAFIVGAGLKLFFSVGMFVIIIRELFR